MTDKTKNACELESSSKLSRIEILAFKFFNQRASNEEMAEIQAAIRRDPKFAKRFATLLETEKLLRDMGKSEWRALNPETEGSN